MSSAGQVVNENGTIHNGCPLAKAVQFCLPESALGEVHAEFSAGGGGAVRFKFHVDKRMTTIDMRGWTSVRFWLEDEESAGLGLLVFWRDALLCTENLFYQVSFSDEDSDGDVDGQYIPVGAYEFMPSVDDSDAVWQAPGVPGNHLVAFQMEKWKRYPVLGNFFSPTVPCLVHFFLKF